MPLHQHVKHRHGEGQARSERGPRTVAQLFQMAHRGQHREHRCPDPILRTTYSESLCLKHVLTYLRWCPVSQTPMRALRIIVLSPLFTNDPRLQSMAKPFEIKTLVA